MLLNVFPIAAHIGCEGNEVMMDLIAAYVARKNGEVPEIFRRNVCRSCLENLSSLLSTSLSDLAVNRP